MKKPHFFCDFCGKEVSGDAKVCPFCGSFFTSVRCPRCGFTAFANKFKFGCPECGYSAPAQEPRDDTPPGGAGRGGRAGKRRSTEPLPLWAYFLAAVLLALSVGVLIAAITN
jgi:ribosomal protein L37E